MQEMVALTDKLTIETTSEGEHLPYVEFVRADGTSTGMAFHGVPGGHEFTSFVLGVYNAAGPGQQVDDADMANIKAIDKDTKIQVLISLSCTMCPDLVVAAQRIASLNDKVTTHIYDTALFPDLRSKYKVMSVPCMVVNESAVSFGKKQMPELLDYLKTVQ